MHLDRNVDNRWTKLNDTYSCNIYHTPTINKMSKIIKKPVVHKTFRLLDFHIYDDKPEVPEDNSSVDSDTPAKRDDGNFVIQMFGINESGETCSLFVSDFQPFFFIKIGDQWNQGNVNLLANEIKQKIGRYYQDAIVSATLVEFNKLYGFSAGKKHKFAKFVFTSTAAFNKVRGLWYQYIKTEDGRSDRKPFPLRSQGVTLELYESTIPPLLRYFHIQNVSPSGWVSLPLNKVTKPSVKSTTCTYEFICKCSSITPMPDKETRVPYKICSFDIEASSSHGDFPLPQKTYKRLAMNMVDVFSAHFRAQPLTVDQSTQLCKKIVLAAFGYAKCDDIDMVYPQIEPSKPKVTKILQTILETSLENLKSLNLSDGDNSELLTIDSIFEKISEDFQQIGEGGNDSDGEAEEDTEPVYVPSKKTNKPMTQKPTKITIVELLMNQEQTRETKVQIINEIFTLQFPRLKGDEVTFIGSTFMRYGESEPYLNHCLVVGTCDPVDGAIIETATTERDLLLQWTNLIQQENPDIIIGYNIFGFDYEFMFRRAQELRVERDFLQLSRKMGEFCAKETKGEKGPEVSIENTKIQLATGEYDLRYFKMTGRIQIDMYTYFRRDFNLSSYKLDDVAGQFISDDVKKIVLTSDPITNNPITQLYSQNLMGLHVGDFIHIEIGGFTSDYYRDGKKFVVQDIQRGVVVTETVKDKEVTNTYNVIVLNGHEDVAKEANGKSIKWGMAKDDVTPQDIFRLAKESSAGRAIVAKYCIQDCNLVHHLMNKIDVITGYVEMSRICSVPISFLIFRGQGIKLTSYVAKKCREKDTLMPDLDKSGSNEGYEGAIVLPPKCSMYMDNPVACVDYASLYPSSMISQNFSHDSKVWSKEYDLDGNLVGERGEKDPKTGKYIYDNLPGFEYIDIEFDNFAYRRNPLKPAAKAAKTKIGKLVCRWAQFPENRKGIMPAILEELLKARATTRKQAKTEKDPFMQNILDKRQLGYKVTANSLYGQCGAKTSTFYEKDVAACTTATGRMMITYAKRIIEEVYGDRVYETAYGAVRTKAEYVYGDTDSVFFTFNLENPQTGEKILGKPALEMTIEIAQDAADLCTQFLKPPMELTYEKTLMPFILLSKKRYVGMLYENDANKGKLKYMGLSLKRRDSCDYLKDVYGGILNILMKENSVQKAIDFLNLALQELIAGNVSMDKLMITKALRGDYKNPQQIAHRVLADRIGQRDPGNKPKPGDRMKFVHIVTTLKKALQGDKIETPEFILSQKLAIDYEFYITNQLMKPLQQLFGLALEQIWLNQNKHSSIKTFKKDMASLHKEVEGDLEVFMKKKEKYCSAKIKALLFDKFLTQIAHKKAGLQTITSMFAAKSK
jgi:DNA polymerase elongation subunit (family B)